MKTPFKFLDPFTLADRNEFFGRDKEVTDLYKLVFQTPLLLVYGLSGTGKTSLIQCGLASRFDGPDWLPLWVRRQSNINTSLQNAIRNVTPSHLRQNPKSEIGNPKSPTPSVSEQIERLYQHYLRPVFLIFDQFEELFILGSPKERADFIAQLKDILDNELPCTVILVIREEYLGQLYLFEKEIPSLFDFRMRVEPMNNENVNAVLSQSFGKFNISVEEPRQARYAEIIQNISRGKSGIELPYLQVYLDRLYREDFKRTFPNESEPFKNGQWLPLEFTRNEIADFGTIDNVLEKFLEEQKSQIQADLKRQDPTLLDDAVKAVLNGFVSDEGTKRPIRFERTEGRLWKVEAADQAFFPKIQTKTFTNCLEALEKARLLRVEENTIELAHDSLALIIDSKRTAEERRRNDIKRDIRLANQTFPTTQEYLSQKKVAAYEDFLPELDLEKADFDFFTKSRQVRQAEAQAALKKERTRRNILLGITAAALVGLAIAVWFYFNAQEATQKAVASEKKAVDKLKEAITEQMSRQKLEINGSERKQKVYQLSGDAVLIKFERERRDSFIKLFEANQLTLDSLSNNKSQ